jgi:hypothetical protein
MLLLLAIASLLSAPVPINRNWLKSADAPVDNLKDGTATLVLVRLTVMPNGKVRTCEVETSNGNKLVRDYACRLYKLRARFKPATDIAGRPTYGIYRTVLSWILNPTTNSMPLLTDLELTVAHLPPKISSPVAVRVMFAVDGMGGMTSCTGEFGEAHPQLVPTACKELLKGYKAIPAKDEVGAAVASVQNAMVGFVVR